MIPIRYITKKREMLVSHKFTIYPDNDENNKWISFCEFYKETTEVKTVDELWNNVSRDGLTVGEMLSAADDDIDIYCWIIVWLLLFS